MTSVPSQNDLEHSWWFDNRGWGRVGRWGAGPFCWVSSALLPSENLGMGIGDDQGQGAQEESSGRKYNPLGGGEGTVTPIRTSYKE